MTAGCVGTCTCGAVRLELAPPFLELHVCHCNACRKANGSAFNLALIASEEQMAWTTKASLREYESAKGKYRAFCHLCGSPVYSRRANLPGTYRLRAGLFAALPRPERLTQGFRDSAWPWANDIFAMAAPLPDRPDHGDSRYRAM